MKVVINPVRELWQCWRVRVECGDHRYEMRHDYTDRKTAIEGAIQALQLRHGKDTEIEVIDE